MTSVRTAEDVWSGWRPGPLLPREDERDGALVFVVAVLCFLAGLTAMGALAGDRAARGWRAQIEAQATVQVRPRPGESGDAAAARAAEALAGVPGVEEAAALERAKAVALLEPYLGTGDLPPDLPIPHLVAVTLDPETPARPAALNQALRAVGVDAVLDDHGRWSEEVRRAGSVARAVALSAALLMTACAAAVVAFATRAGLAARRNVVEVLHLSGAEDLYIAKLFQARFARMALVAGLYGAVAAAGLGALARWAGGGAGLVPVLPLAWSDLIAAAPVPLLAALTAAWAARRTALAIVQAEP
jgi:cell division transport system permease protein